MRGDGLVGRKGRRESDETESSPVPEGDWSLRLQPSAAGPSPVRGVCVPWDMSGGGPGSAQTCTRWGWGGARGRTGTRSPAPHPKPGFCDAVRALRVTCACAEDYSRAREAAPQPGIAAM